MYSGLNNGESLRGQTLLFLTRPLEHLTYQSGLHEKKKIITDNSFDMIPPALDNGELNSTMANQIVYSPTETILEGYFCPQMVPSSCETKWCSIIIVLICFGALSKCHIGKVSYTDLSMSYCFK